MNDKYNIDEKLINWLTSNVSSQTQLPYSFQIQENQEKKVYHEMGDIASVSGIIERIIVKEGLVVYDGAVQQIALAMIGGQENLEKSFLPLNIYWNGYVNETASIRAGYPINSFIYDPDNPEAVSSDLSDKGKRGFIFRIINANGKYLSSDPLDGKTSADGFPRGKRIHWEDWKPIAGENAWVVMAALHLYHKKYYDPYTQSYPEEKDSVELQLAEEIARAAMMIQAENGGIRMAPIGTYHKLQGDSDIHSERSWWYNQISSENNLSWYAAFRMLHETTGDIKYEAAMVKIEGFFQQVWDEENNYFYQGMTCENGQWYPNKEHFALDVQTWGILAFGPKKIDGWFGEGSSYEMWRTSKEYSGMRNANDSLLGVGYTQEHDRISVEWTAGAIMAARNIGEYYEPLNWIWAVEAQEDAREMRSGIESLRKNVSDDKTAYSYSSKRQWIPFGWFSHSPEVLSLASTGWVVFTDAEFNPFSLSSHNASDSQPTILGSIEKEKWEKDTRLD